MTNSRAILLGAMLVAASFWMHSVVRPAVAMGNGPFALMHHSNTSANAGVFRMDTATGEVSYCYLPLGGQVEVICSKAVK